MSTSGTRSSIGDEHVWYWRYVVDEYVWYPAFCSRWVCLVLVNWGLWVELIWLYVTTYNRKLWFDDFANKKSVDFGVLGRWIGLLQTIHQLCWHCHRLPMRWEQHVVPGWGTRQHVVIWPVEIKPYVGATAQCQTSQIQFAPIQTDIMT